MAETNILSWCVGTRVYIGGFYGKSGNGPLSMFRIGRVGLLGRRAGMVMLADGSVQKPLMFALSNIQVKGQGS